MMCHAREAPLAASRTSVCFTLQVVNFSEEIRSQLYKIASISLCSNLGGQIIMSLVMSPPKVRFLHRAKPLCGTGYRSERQIF